MVRWQEQEQGQEQEQEQEQEVYGSWRTKTGL